MTAPNVTSNIAPAAAPAPVAVVEQQPSAAPVVEQAPAKADEPSGVHGVIDRLSRKVSPEALAEPLVEAPAAALNTPTNADGTVATPAADAPVVMVAEIKSDEPEGEVVLRARDPKTGQFSDMDQTRTYELSIKDKATGETRVYNKTLPDLMRMAKDGIAGNRARDELTYYRTKTPEWQQSHTQMSQEVEGLRALTMELLTAPEDQVVARREAYLAEQSPEKQLARLKAQNQAEETRRQLAAQNSEAGRHAMALAQNVGPVVDEVKALVGPEAAAGKLAMDTASLMVNGRIPPERFPQLKAYIEGPYRAWAKAEAAKRSAGEAEVAKQREATLETQRRAQLAAQNVGSATRPTGAMNGSVQPAPGKPKNVNEAMDRIIHRPLAASA